MRLPNRVAIVSGAARGIGAAEARALADAGARVVIGDLLDDQGHALAEEINRRHGEVRAHYLHLDATKRTEWQEAGRLAQASWGPPTVLVNNAGVHGRLGLEQTSEDEWERVMDADLKSAFLGMQVCIPAMRAAGGGAIVNTSSVYGLVASGSATAYHSAKGGVVMLSKSAAVEYAGQNIRVNCIHPGLIDTPMTATLPAQWRERLLAQTPMRRAARPEEVASAVVFLVSDDASFITGTTLIIDGGLTAM